MQYTSNQLVIVGAGAHSKVVIDVIEQEGKYKILGLVDSCFCDNVLGYPVLGNDDMLQNLYDKGLTKAFVAIGNNKLRAKLIRKVKDIGFELVSAISPNAVVSRYAVIGNGTVIMPGTVINACVKIGEGCIINTNASVDHDCVVEDCVHIAPGCAISGSTVIGRGTFLGTGTKVIDRICIGKEVVAGAGTTIVKNIFDDVVVVGTPARIVKEK